MSKKIVRHKVKSESYSCHEMDVNGLINQAIQKLEVAGHQIVGSVQVSIGSEPAPYWERGRFTITYIPFDDTDD